MFFIFAYLICFGAGLFGSDICLRNIENIIKQKHLELHNLLKIGLGLLIIIIPGYYFYFQNNSDKINKNEWLQFKNNNNCEKIKEDQINNIYEWKCDNGVIYINSFKN